MMKCFICGCSEHSACYPPCSWHAPELCSHCADPEAFLEADRQLHNSESLEPLTPSKLRDALLLLGLNCMSRELNNNFRRVFMINTMDEKKNQECRAKFEAIIEAWFPLFTKTSVGAYDINLSQVRPRLELISE